MRRESADKKKAEWRTDFTVGTLAQIVGGGLVALAVAAAPAVWKYLGVHGVVYLALSVALLCACALVAREGILLIRHLQHPIGGQPATVELVSADWSELAAPYRQTSLKILSSPGDDIGQLTIEVDIHAQIRADEPVARAFQTINQQREAAGLFAYYDAVRFLPVSFSAADREPGLIRIRVVPIDYSVIAILSDPGCAPGAKQHAQSILHSRVKADQLFRQAYDGGLVGLLGVQLCIVTSDGKTLLRRRGKNVLFARGRWDVAVSGFSGSRDRVDEAGLDVTLTMEHELANEIGRLRADPRSIRILGVTQNSLTGAFDVLACWPIDATSKDLLSLLVKKGQFLHTIFPTEIKAVERYVWDSENLIVDTDPTIMANAWRGCKIAPADFEPQSLLCVELTLAYLGGLSAVRRFREHL